MEFIVISVIFQRTNSICLFLKKPSLSLQNLETILKKVHSTFLHNSFSSEHNYVLIRLLFNERQTRQNGKMGEIYVKHFKIAN